MTAFTNNTSAADWGDSPDEELESMPTARLGGRENDSDMGASPTWKHNGDRMSVPRTKGMTSGNADSHDTRSPKQADILRQGRGGLVPKLIFRTTPCHQALL